MSNTVRNIVELLDIMTYLNVFSFSVLSGSGTCISPSLQELDIIEELCKDMAPNKRPYNILFTDSLYKRSLPLYANEINNPYNFESYQWVDKKRKKTIDIDVMASSIVSCCSLVEKLITNRIQLENNPFIAFILFKTALHQGRFIKHHLKIGDLYYSAEDVSDNPKETHIEIASKNPNITSQLTVLQAFTALNRLSVYNIPYIHAKDEEFNEDIELLSHLYANVLEHISDIKSRELANIGLSITAIYINNDAPCKNTHKILDSIGRELLERLNANGGIARTRIDIEESSIITICNSLNLLSQLYYMFGNRAYHQGCINIYSRLCSLWDKESCIFRLKDSNKQSYSIKDISAIISALLSLHAALKDESLIAQLEEQIKGFFETAFVKSQIFVGQTQPILQESLMKDIPHPSDDTAGTPPIFNKAFEYKLSKRKFYSDADVYRADYVLPACCQLLNNISSGCM